MNIWQNIMTLPYLTFDRLKVPEKEYCYKPEDEVLEGANGFMKEIKFTSPQQKWEHLYNTMTVKNQVISPSGTVIIGDVKGQIKYKVDRMFANKSRYEDVSFKFPNPIRWYHVALFHEMECSQNFNCYLGNGQPWHKKTTIVPKGRGAFKSFTEGAVDAIRLKKLQDVYDWSIGNTLYLFEGFNGYGYTQYRNINTPYLWSGTNHYESGKYVADGRYNPNAISAQIGVAPLLSEILKRL